MKKIILIVDDDTTSLKLAKSILDEEYRIATVNSGSMVFKYLEKNTPDLVLLDINMPDMDGFSVLSRIRDYPQFQELPIIFLTADQDPKSEAKCLESGAMDFVNKPFVPAVLKSRVRRIIELMTYRNQLESMVTEQSHIITSRTERIEDIQNSIIIGMANLIESRDNSTGRHVKNTQTYVEMIADKMYEKRLYPNILTDEYKSYVIKSAPLHDVGKIRIPDAILQKPGRLTEEEFEIIKGHAEFGAEIIDDILGNVEEKEYLTVAREMALYHHERWDGTGYPHGLSGEAIPLSARIMAVADVFDALYEDRCYKRGIRPMKLTMDIIEEGRGLQFDPVITDVFMGLTEEIEDYLGEK